MMMMMMMNSSIIIIIFEQTKFESMTYFLGKFWMNLNQITQSPK